MPEDIKAIGQMLGYVSTFIGLYAILKTKLLAKSKGFIEKESGKQHNDQIHDNINKHLIQLDAQVSQIAVANDDIRNRIDAYIASQMEVNKKIMADIIETAYHANKATKTIEINRFRHLSEVYNVYHGSPLHGNSYITEIYEEMCKWEKL